MGNLTRKKRVKSLISSIRNGKDETTTDHSEIQKILNKYYKKLYSQKYENLKEMYQNLEVRHLPRLSQNEVEMLNRPISSSEIASTIQNLRKKKAWDQMASQQISTKPLKRN